MATKKAKKDADNLATVLAKIAAWREPYNAIGQRLHEIITTTMPDLKPRPWYGMPGYAKDGPVLVFFRVDNYMTFGLTEKVNFTIKDGAPDQLMPAPGSLATWTTRPRPRSRTSCGWLRAEGVSSGLV